MKIYFEKKPNDSYRVSVYQNTDHEDFDHIVHVRWLDLLDKWLIDHFDMAFVKTYRSERGYNEMWQSFCAEFQCVEDEAFFLMLTSDGLEL